MIRAAIFDLDGLLIDSEPLWRRVEREVFLSVGVVLSEDDCRSTIGMRCDAVVAKWLRDRPWTDVPPDEVQRRIEEGVCARIHNEGQALSGVDHALALVLHLGLRVGVASSSPPVIIDAALERLGIGRHFEVRCSAAGLPEGKPHPAVYLEAAKALGVSPVSCIAFEDSLPGIDAALAAGMKAVAVPDPSTDQRPFLERGATVLNSLEELESQHFGKGPAYRTGRRP